MKKIYILMLIVFFICYFLYYNNKTETVLLSGKVFGFDIQSEIKDNLQKDTNKLATSLKKIGTVTFIKKENKRFVALGHSIKEIKNKAEISGKCYNINLDKIEKSKKNKPGKIIGDLNRINQIGNITAVNNYGLFGNMNETSNLKEIKTQSRFKIKKDKAEIFININGKNLKSYRIRITDINYFHENQNIKFEIESDELMDYTGGIVQGMSGAPIVQNGKLIGAVNYVDMNNPNEGYGIFIDKLL